MNAALISSIKINQHIFAAALMIKYLMKIVSSSSKHIIALSFRLEVSTTQFVIDLRLHAFPPKTLS